MMRPKWTMNALGMLAVCIAALAASCSDSHPKNQGGETHFLKACVEGMCGDALECVCGVCTKNCDGSDACSSLGEDIACQQIISGSPLCEVGRLPIRVCDVECGQNSDCDVLGDDYECVEARCRPEVVASQITARQDASVADPVDPLLFIVLDTSGSMELLAGCTCVTASCAECRPDCSASVPQKNRWAQTLEALTGTYRDFSCIAHDRTDTAFTYDRGYAVPYHEPLGTQDDDGILDLFADDVRFGIATFDAIATYGDDRQLTLDEVDFAQSQAEPGLWSYPESLVPVGRSDGTLRGVYCYDAVDFYWMDTGIRSANASHGALLAAIDPATAESTARAIESSLLRTRPYGGAPIAAALDDLSWYFAADSASEAERADSTRKRHVVLITDGRPDDDYRNVHCDCNEREAGKSCSDYFSPGVDTSSISCPYPTPEQAARYLRCGYGELCDDGVVDRVYTIGLNVPDDPTASLRVEDIAQEGGAEARFATNGEELRAALTSIIEEIMNDSAPESD